MNRIAFTVLGEPRPKGSTRAFVRRAKDGRHFAVTTSDNPHLKGWEDSIRHEAQRAAQGQFFSGPIAVSLMFGFCRPASVSVTKRPHHVVKPDLDKLARAAVDAVSKILFSDDAAVVALKATKQYVTTGPAFVRIVVAPFLGEAS